MANFEHILMIALNWCDEIITDMNWFKYIECAKTIISMSTLTNYVGLVGLLHEKLGANSENNQIDISEKYLCSMQNNNTIIN